MIARWQLLIVPLFGAVLLINFLSISYGRLQRELGGCRGELAALQPTPTALKDCGFYQDTVRELRRQRAATTPLDTMQFAAPLRVRPVGCRQLSVGFETGTPTPDDDDAEDAMRGRP